MNNALPLQTVALGYGKVVLTSTRANYTVFRLKPPSEKDSGVTTGKRLGTTSLSQIGRYKDINGTMYRTDVGHPPGTFLMFQASKARGAFRIADAAIILHLRPEAALISIVAKLPTGYDNMIGDNYEVFRGRADIMSPEEATVYQITLSRNYLSSFFEQDEIAEMFEVFELQPEAIAKPSVALVSTSTGLITREVAHAPVRRMRFKK